MTTDVAQRKRTVLAIAVSAIVAALLYLQAVDLVRFSGQRVGYYPGSEVADGVTVDGVTPGLPAERGGMRAGDVLQGVAGHPVRSVEDVWVATETLQRGRPTEFRVIREGRELTLQIVPGMPPDWKQWVVNALAAIAHLMVTLLVLLQKGWDPRGRQLILFSLAVAVEFSLPAGSSSFWFLISTLAAFYLLTGFQFAVELHLAARIPDRHPWLELGPLVIPALYATGLGLGLATACAVVSDRLGLELLPWSSDQATSLLFDWVMPVWAVLLVLLLGDQARRSPEPAGRSQALLVLLGVTPWVVYVFGTTVAAWGDPTWVQPGWLAWLFPLVMLSYPVAVFVAIYRYDLVDLELVVRRSLVYGVLTAALLLLFYAMLGAGGALLSQAVDPEGQAVWVIALATLVLGLIFAPLRRGVQAVIDNRAFPQRGQQRGLLIELASELPALGQLPAMGQHLTESLDDIFRLSSSTILLADAKTGVLATLASSADDGDSELDHSFLLAPEDPGVRLLEKADRPLSARLLGERSSYLREHLDALEADLAVPLLHHEHLVGVLLLGGKTSGRELRGEELELLSLLAHHVASVFENARLFVSATYESLTGLLRREKILEELEREVHRARRYGRPLTVGMADLDNFKLLNDSFGHLAGDTVLKRVAQVLSRELRSTDLVGRYGGEEFLLLLPETDLPGAIAVAEKLRQAVEEAQIHLDGGRLIQVTLSIGLATLQGEPKADAGSSRLLIDEADQALYRAKREGKNRVLPTVTEDGRPVTTVRSG